MFGIWRTLLALEVVAFHLLPMPLIGAYSVFSFFVLSGFLMTEIMQRTYGYASGGFARYIGNRALRLLPNYWFAIIITLLVITVVGEANAYQFHKALTVPDNFRDWAQNISMIFFNWLPKNETPRLVTLAWALTVEIFYYIAIGLGASRTRATTFIWLGLSLAYVVIIRQIFPEGGGYLYDAVPAGSLPFSVGALAWHYQDELCAALARFKLSDPRLLIAGRWVLYGGILGLLTLTGWKWLAMFGNWVNIGVSASIIVALFAVRPEPKWRQIDKAVGDFSYPIYLLHLQMGLLAGILLYDTPTNSGLMLFVVALIFTIALGAICARGIDPVVDRWRQRIKNK
jgi:peptidoglycan/LPS O-acetylase OafA/YrhL